MRARGNRAFQRVIFFIAALVVSCWPVRLLANVYLDHLYVSLSWWPNPESDVRGYEVHRSNYLSGPYAKVNADLISGTSWTDTKVTDGSTYYYKVCSVDMCGNIGAFSPPSDAVIIAVLADEVTMTVGPAGSPNPAASSGSANCSVTAVDSFGHSLTYQWSATGGIFDNPAARNPLWYSPANNSGIIKNYDLSVIITCSGGQWVGGSFTEKVLPDNNQAPVAEAGENQLVRGLTPVALNGCGSRDPDNAPSRLTYQWKQTGGKTMVGLGGANTCKPTFVSPNANDTLIFTLTVNDGIASATDTVTITVDSQAPELLPEDLGPYPQQGLDGSIGPASDTCIRARVLDNMAVNLSSSTCRSVISAYGVYADGSSERFEPLVGQMVFTETDPGIVWMMFVPDYRTAYGSGLPYGFTVDVTIEACDLAGNSMEPYPYRFKVRSARPRLPNQTRSTDPHPSQPGDVLSVTLQEGDLKTTRMEYQDTVAVAPYFGPASEIPMQLLNGGPRVWPLNLQPPMVFPSPVKLLIALPGRNNLKKYKIYHYDPNPAVAWQEATVGDGWLEYRQDHETSSPPTIELWIRHFTGVALRNH